jgi:hypothetical protein
MKKAKVDLYNALTDISLIEERINSGSATSAIRTSSLSTTLYFQLGMAVQSENPSASTDMQGDSVLSFCDKVTQRRITR